MKRIMEASGFVEKKEYNAIRCKNNLLLGQGHDGYSRCRR